MSEDVDADLLQVQHNINKHWSERARSPWSWLQFSLLVLILVAGCIGLGVQQRQNYLALSRQQQEIAADQQSSQLLTGYINSVSDMLLYDNLLYAKPNDVKKKAFLTIFLFHIYSVILAA